MIPSGHDDAGLRDVLVALAASAGVMIDDATAARLTPILASVLSDWKVLTHGAAPRVEPVSIGRWPEDSRGRA